MFTASLLDLRFLGLLLAIGLLRWLCPPRHYVAFGVAASALAVGLAAPATFFTISAIVLGFIFPLHRLVCLARERHWAQWLQASLVPVGVSLLVLLLLVSKVHRNFTLPWFGETWLNHEIAALIGFSYFLFRAISFLHIQSILRFKEATPGPLLFYTLFPPTLTSGPIHKFQDFKQQLAAPAPLTRELIGAVAYRVTRGYFRKIAVAFVLNEWVSRLLAQSELTVFTSLLTIIALYLYFYFDFAGYSDIAIGLGLLIGIKVPENFRKPFTATTISEFWRNWHITLVDWFRDHVFIPLGGMQSSRGRAGMLALVVMVLCGLWHGMTVAFIAWGAWHGVALLAEALSGTKPVPPANRHGVGYWSRVVWTNSRVALPCILFLPNTADITRILLGFTHWSLA
jgi:alginate O-acetyltransferase complex protein AlgI